MQSSQGAGACGLPACVGSQSRRTGDGMTRGSRGGAKLARRVAIVAVTAFAGLATVPAAASAVTVWVSPEMVKPPFNSCAAPQFNAIQTAIAGSVAGTEIRVCKGTYTEQLTIEKEFSIVGEAGVIVTLPASPANSTSTCDIQKAGEYEEQDLVTICG